MHLYYKLGAGYGGWPAANANSVTPAIPGAAEAREIPYAASRIYPGACIPYAQVGPPAHDWGSPLYHAADNHAPGGPGLLLPKPLGPLPPTSGYSLEYDKHVEVKGKATGVTRTGQAIPAIAIPPSACPGEKQLRPAECVTPPLIEGRPAGPTSQGIPFLHKGSPIPSALFYPYDITTHDYPLLSQKYAQPKDIFPPHTAAPVPGTERDPSPPAPPQIQGLSDPEGAPHVQQSIGSCIGSYLYQLQPNIDTHQDICSRDFPELYDSVPIYDQRP